MDARVCSLSRVSFGLELVGIGSGHDTPPRGAAVRAPRPRRRPRAPPPPPGPGRRSGRAGAASTLPRAGRRLAAAGGPDSPPHPPGGRGANDHRNRSPTPAVGTLPAWARRPLSGRAQRARPPEARILAERAQRRRHEHCLPPSGPGPPLRPGRRSQDASPRRPMTRCRRRAGLADALSAARTTAGTAPHASRRRAAGLDPSTALRAGTVCRTADCPSPRTGLLSGRAQCV